MTQIFNVAESLIPRGGSGGGPYNGPSPTNVTVGALLAGTDITGLTPNQIIALMTNTYLAPTFSSFAITGVPATLEVGDSISGSKNFTWGFTNSGNVQAGTLDINDVTGSANIVTNTSTASPYAHLFSPAIVRTTPGSWQWQVSATNTNAGNFNRTLTVNWLWMRYYGTSANATLTESQIEALTNATLTSAVAGNYTFATNNYKYICYADYLGDINTIIDTATGFNVPLATSSDNAAYSNTQGNGLTYATVSVTNAFGQTTLYRVYRSKNTLSAASTFQVTV